MPRDGRPPEVVVESVVGPIAGLTESPAQSARVSRIQGVSTDVPAGETERTGPFSASRESFAAMYLPRVHRFAVMVSGPGVDPEDVAQDSMVAALSRLDQFDPSRGSMDAWLWRIVVNRARDAGRLAGRGELLLQRFLAQGPDPAENRSPEAVALERLDGRELIAAIHRLPRRHRTLIALRYGAGLSSPEIASLLGTTRMAVVQATRRALDRLRRDLEDHRK